MASLSHLDAPGAYPTTPLNEEPKHQTHHNKLHKREDPRGLSGNMSHNQQSINLNSVGSGARVDESSFAYGTDQSSSSPHNPLHHTSFNETKETPRNLEKDGQYRGHRFTDSGVDVGDAPIGRETAKPGVMTGAYSRVGTQDSAFAPASVYTYDQSSAAKPQSGIKSEHGANTRSADTPTNLAAPVNTPAESAKLDLDSNTTANSQAGQGNEAQSDLPVNSDTKRNEPYWGDLPYGAGVYNGVTGHGSNESTAHQKSTHDQFSTTTTNPGVHNGVIGHGSHESTSPQVSKHDPDMAMKDSSREQRVFPLSNDANTKTVSNLNNTEKRGRDSHMKEVLAGAGATAAGGYAAHEYLNKDDNKKLEATDDKRVSEKPSKLEQSKSATTSSPQSQKKTESVADKNEGKESLAAVIPTKHSESKTAEKKSEKTGNEKQQEKSAKHEKNEKDNKIEKDEKDNSDLGYFGAAAAAATGVGAYGMHEQAKRNNSKEHSSNPENKASLSAVPHSTAREPARDKIEPLNNNVSKQATSHEQPRSNIPATGALAGIDSNTANQSHNTAHSGPSHSNVPSEGTSSNIVTGRRKPTDHSSTDSSHGGQYNVLSSGTPSGINLEQQDREGQFLKLSATPPTSQGRTATSTVRQTQQARDPKLQAAAMPMPMPTSGVSKKEATMKENEYKNEKSNTHAGAAAMGAGAMGAGAGAGALMSGGHSSVRKVTHRCTKCGEENDISEYVMI
ncbi:hypothetical protein GGR51DRAFT_262196 [Nemania sp. FL0031]|nr:hypothetical protein GGR51DRAFT_262196 [Nemania sp. FL0031]